MKWVFIGVGALIAIVLVIVIVGTLLPRDHVATVTARIAGVPDSVWRTITDVADHPAWRSDVRRVEVLPPTDGKTTWREHSSNGAILMVVDRAEPPRRLVTRIADEKLPYGGTWDFVIAPSGDQGSCRHDHGARLGLQSGVSLRVAFHPRPHRDDGHLSARTRPQVWRRRHADGRRTRSLNHRLISEGSHGLRNEVQGASR